MLSLDHCWKYFKIAELTEVMRQKGDQIFIDLLNNIRVGNVTDNDVRILQSRFIEEDNPCYPVNAIHIWAENALVERHNMEILNNLPGPQHELVAFDQVPENISDSVLNKVYARTQMNTGGLAHKLIIEKGAKVMITAKATGPRESFFIK